MIVAIAIYLAIGAVLAFDAGGLPRSDDGTRWGLLADLACFLAITLCWFPLALWALAEQARR